MITSGVEHLNLTVADLDEATDFFTGVFGCQTLYTMGPFESRRSPFTRVIANADVRSTVHHVRVLRSPQLNIELFDVTTPRQRTVWPDLLDIGGWSLTARVHDLGPAADFLAEHDLYDLGGGRYMTPFGLPFQIVGGPPGVDMVVGAQWQPGPGSLPGFCGFQRMQVTVGELEPAGRFLMEVLGFERVDDLLTWPTWPPGVAPGQLAAVANVDVRATPGPATVLRSRYLEIELVECAEYPGQNRLWPGMFDVGGWHLAFYVDDMDAAYADLLDRDLFVLGQKKPAYMYEAGDQAYTLHCLAPFGLYFELVTYPHGRYREADYCGPAWHPGRGAAMDGR